VAHIDAKADDNRLHAGGLRDRRDVRSDDGPKLATTSGEGVVIDTSYLASDRDASHDAYVAALRLTLERFWPSRRGYAYDEFCR
jgi:hypothetical protein